MAIQEWQDARPELHSVPALGVTHRILRSARLIDAALGTAVAQAGLRGRGDFETLVRLRRTHPGRPSVAQVAQDLLVTPSAMTGRIDRLENVGLVRRQPDPTDRRTVRIALTENGKHLVDEVLEGYLETHDRLLAAFDEGDRATLAELLARLLIELGDEGHPSPRSV